MQFPSPDLGLKFPVASLFTLSLSKTSESGRTGAGFGKAVTALGIILGQNIHLMSVADDVDEGN